MKLMNTTDRQNFQFQQDIKILQAELQISEDDN